MKSLALVLGLAVAAAVVPAHAAAQKGTILTPTDTQKLLPSAVYYKGQSAPSQLRNSGGVKFADGYYVLATLVDNSGYSSDVATKYQAYFVTEVPIEVGGHKLPAGVYGAGFLPGNKFVLTDVGGHDVLTAASTHDDVIKRPMPLKFTTDPAGGYRLYAGRNYVKFRR
ncbi:MAG: hypothetical protein ACLGSD_00780 [Acidobacteriota bacterium]